VSSAGVLAVVAVAVVLGLRPMPGTALAMRATAAAPVAAPAPAATAPGALLAPVAAGRMTASRGDVAYLLAGSALTLEDIPFHALSAYQRAAAVIDTADDQCHLDWQLLAAMGKVLSDHGRVGGSRLDDDGVPRPVVMGQRLTGRHGTQRVPDSDAGKVDGDSRVDRAVGPMMLLPSVWSVVSVDGDGDGRRNPQDVDDAALGAAVLLCSGPGDLRNPAHRRSEVRRFHSGADYTRSVLSVRNAYLDAESVTTTSVLAREQGVDVAADPLAEPTLPPEDQTFGGGDQGFEPGTGATAAVPTQPSTAPSPTSSAPGASPSASGAPTPSSTPSPSDDPSPTGSESPTSEPTDCASPSDDATPSGSPTASPTDTPSDDPTECATATPTGTTPSGSPIGPASSGPSSDDAPAAGLAVPLVPLLPLGAWLLRRRRRTDAIGVDSAV
jgi:hypothetical protein